MLAKIKAWRPARRPKLPPTLAEFAQRHLASFTRDFWIWSLATAILTGIVAALMAKIFLAGANLSTEAILTGQRVILHVDTGDAEGNARHTKIEKAATDTPASPNTPIISKEGLAPAPLESISAQVDKGLVPMVGRDGTLPWKYYARPFKGDPKRPIVAVVLANLGLSKPLTEEVLQLPHNFTLSFSPYASDARKWAQSAREEGFETLVDLPMESADYVRTGLDPGPYGLRAEATADENSARLRWVLSRFPGFVGMLAPENENLSSNVAAIRPMLVELAGHGVLFLYLKTGENAPLADLIKTRRFYALGVDRVIDDDIEPGPIDKQLQDLVALARTQGYAVGFAHSYPPTLEALARWSEELSAQGIDLAPVSAVGLRAFP